MKCVPQGFPDGERKKHIYYKKFKLRGFRSFKNKTWQIYLVQKGGGAEIGICQQNLSQSGD